MSPQPNYILRNARELCGWSQSYVAEHIQSPASSYISRWERGITTPSPYYREKLCHLFNKNAEELGLIVSQEEQTTIGTSKVARKKKQLTETASNSASDTVSLSHMSSLTPAWLIPWARNPFFTGREEILKTLHTRLGADQVAIRNQAYALLGLGGVGKTQLALEYAYQYGEEYRAVFWIEAETAEQIISAMLQIAELLQLPERNDKNQQHIVIGVQRWLVTNSQWLLIWDNVEDLDLLKRFLPATRQGAILITTCHQAIGTIARGLSLFPMEHEEGMLFLLRRAKVLEPEVTIEQLSHLAESKHNEYMAALELVKILGGLPLALDQAGAYIEETGCGLTSYLQRYTQKRSYLLDQRGEFGEAHPQSVVATFKLSREQVKKEQSTALDILCVCSLLHAEAIPEELFILGASHLGPELRSLMNNVSQFDQAIGILRNLSLLQRQPDTSTLSLHRLVQAVMREQMNEQEQALWFERVLAALNTLIPEIPLNNWEKYERLFPHVLVCLAAISEQAEDALLIEVLQKTADYLRARAQYEQAEPLYLRALRIGERILHSQHPQVASVLNHLANLYYDQGKYEQAEPLYLRALHIRQQATASERSSISMTLDHLARLYWAQGKYAQAESLSLQAIHNWELILDPNEALNINSSLNTLAIIYVEQGKYAPAENLFERARDNWERHYGLEDTRVVAANNNLALLLYYQGKYAPAELLYQQVLHTMKKTLGKEHPELAHPLQGLADIYRDQGQYTQAESLYQQALHIRERALGSTHPLVAQIHRGMANLYMQQEKSKLAASLFQSALYLQEKQLGENHPETAQTLYDFAILHQKQNRLSEASSMAARALKIRTQSLGDKHPTTVVTRILSTQLTQANTYNNMPEGVNPYEPHPPS